MTPNTGGLAFPTSNGGSQATTRGTEMTQPEALALADILDQSVLQAHADAASELRRLHESNQELIAALKALVEADAPDYIKSSIWEHARAAIAKGEQK